MSNGMTPMALPRLDGAGVLNRRIRRRFEASGMTQEQALGWARIYARALRGSCWIKDSLGLQPFEPNRVPPAILLLLREDYGKWTCTACGHQFLREIKSESKTHT